MSANISTMELEFATITSVTKSISGSGRPQIQISFQTEAQTHSLICPSVFSNHSKFGRIFEAVTGIKPNQFSGSDPSLAMIGRPCQILVGDSEVESEHRVCDVIPIPSPQLELGLKFEAD